MIFIHKFIKITKYNEVISIKGLRESTSTIHLSIKEQMEESGGRYATIHFTTIHFDYNPFTTIQL